MTLVWFLLVFQQGGGATYQVQYMGNSGPQNVLVLAPVSGQPGTSYQMVSQASQPAAAAAVAGNR